ncbi:MAG TPA: methyltransferase domain-containing protein [Pyrinomonadaceae bacterium]|nr:methyltransferase domain-containing protein [Pyrinomonadaceae bacterium]
MLEDAQTKAATTYNAASDFYDHPANTFWSRYGRRTVERLRLAPGQRVLDVCCGSGASAIPAAEAVGPTGSVVGVDLADSLLALARSKAEQLELKNIEFRSGDMTQLPFAEGSFDVVVCVFGIFFVPDMEAALRELKRVLRGGGKLAITTWGPRFFEPATTAFWASVRSVRPELYKGFNPWDRISDAGAVRSLLAAAGLDDVDAVAESDSQPVNSPEDWWAMIMGSGYRGTVEQLAPADRERVHLENLDFIRRTSLHSLESNVVYASAFK